MRAQRPASAPEAAVERQVTIIWIDARAAVIGQWRDEQARLERLESDVPAHHRSTGHVRHDPTLHGGGGPGSAGEPNRLEHLRQFVDRVADRLPAGDDLLILGPGTVREHLERRVRELDEHHGRSRAVACEPAARITDRQLIARLRHVIGADPRRGWLEQTPGGQ